MPYRFLPPQSSLITYSHGQDHRRPHNGDGFGLGYYTSPHLHLGPSPCIFTSTTPAWNNINLSRLAQKTASNLIFAHVRATTEGSLSDSNCHPFAHKSLMWMHNGNIAGWRDGVKRKVAVSVGERWFGCVEGSTDSEWAFALFLDCLDRAGHDPDDDGLTENGFGHTALRAAMLQTITRINAFVTHTNTDDRRSLLNFAVTDGKSVICTRYVSSHTDEAASLYFSSGTNWKRETPEGEFKMERRDRGADIVLVASEPLTFERDNWVTVPTNSTITIHKQTVLIHPIVDEYYHQSPSYLRSSGFALSKGQVSDAAADGGTEAEAKAKGESIEGLEEKLKEVEVGG